MSQLQNYEMSIAGEEPEAAGKVSEDSPAASLPDSVQKIKEMNVDTLTPIEALNLVYKIRKELDHE